MAYISFQPKDHFNTKLYTGNATDDTAITGVGFQPDWLWGKNRTDATNHYFIDAVRGVTKEINSNNGDAEGTDATLIKSFDSDGFTLGNGSLNQSSKDFVTWNWKANGAGSANTDGTINTTYTSANTTSGFSICQWTGTGANGTVGHGLGVAPKMIIFKNTNTATDWDVYHGSLANTERIHLNTTGVKNTAAHAFNSTSPTTAVFSVGTADNTNKSSSPMIAYCFAEKTGFSKFGSYEGNASTNGPFVYTGFKPAFVMMKGIDSGGSDNWNTCDNKRVGYNAANWRLYPNAVAGENTTSLVDLLSNGFKLRVSSTDVNASAKTYIFMAFAEAPLVGNNNVPATAR